jgi:drug/metabolite transporter (DMT)-like permease
MTGQTATLPRYAWLIFAALCLVWGSTWIAADALAQQVPPLCAAAARFLLSAALLLPFLLRRRHAPIPVRVLGGVLLLSVTMIVLPMLLLLWARPQLPSATVVVLFAAMPLVVILLTPAFAEKDVPPRAMQAAVAGMGGLVLAMGASFSVAQAGAAALVLLAVVSTGASSLAARRLCLHHSPIAITSWLLAAAGLLLLLASRILERGQLLQWNRHTLAAIVLLAVVGGAPAYAAWFWLLQRLEAYQLVAVQWIEPLVALGESALLLRMGLSASMIAGSLITLVSLLVLLKTRAEDDDTVSLRAN